jgi:hypothetical protein
LIKEPFGSHVDATSGVDTNSSLSVVSTPMKRMILRVAFADEELGKCGFFPIRETAKLRGDWGTAGFS